MDGGLQSRRASALLAPKLGDSLTAEVGPRMIVQFNVANKAALLPAMWQVDHGFASVANHAVEGHVFDLAIAVEDFDAVEFDVIAAHNKLEPRKFAIPPADMDRIVIVDKADMAVAQPHPLVAVGDVESGSGPLRLPGPRAQQLPLRGSRAGNGNAIRRRE